MDNEFVIKNKIMQTFETGNIIIDLILGKTTPDDIINNIFSLMCVGK